MGYRRRILDDWLDEFQPHLRALALFGPKSVGKTATAMQRARTSVDLSRDSERRILAADPDLVAGMDGPLLIDEWQRLPEVWDAVKRAVDTDPRPGHFIIAGSSAPRGATVHSGAGRIVPVRMRPLSLAERDLETPTVSFADLLHGRADLSGRSSLALVDYVEEITASGFPGLRPLPARLRDAELDAYLENVVLREFAEQGYPVRRPHTLRGWLAAYAAATASTASYTKILDAATPGDTDKPAKTTTITYRDALTSLWLLDPIDAWLPRRNHLDRLAQAPKHLLADPALAVRLLGLSRDSLLRGSQGVNPQLTEGEVLGRLFEALTAQSVLTYAQAADARINHLRLRDGQREVDLIATRPDGKILALEVKLSGAVEDADVRHLLWLQEQLGDDVVDAVVVNTGPGAYRRRDGIGVVPLALLGP